MPSLRRSRILLRWEKTINNIPGVLENGLFVGVATEVLVGEVKDGQASVRSL
jgi:ribose 5-phosphate isomerase A